MIAATYPVVVHGRTIFSKGGIIPVSSPCFVLGERPPYAIKMLKEIFQMSVRDFDVLTLCSKAPLSRWQCTDSMKESAAKLDEWGLVEWASGSTQRWVIATTGRNMLTAIHAYVGEYQPARITKAVVLPFPHH